MKDIMQDYNRIVSEITPKRSDDELLKAVIGKAGNTAQKKKLNFKTAIIPIAAALALICTACTAVVYYEHLTSVFGENQTLSSEIQTNLFEDSDEHIRISVDQLMSDGRSLYASVHYQALDDVGKEWLERKTEYIYYSLGFRFDGEKSNYCLAEISEQRTESDKYFYVLGDVPYELWRADESELNGSFGYSLPTDLIKETDIDLSGTFDTKSYKIVGDERCNKYLTPTRLEISPLSYALYANNDYGVGTWNKGLAVSWAEFNNEVCYVDRALVMSDGEKITLPISGEPCIFEDGTYLWSSDDIYDFKGIESSRLDAEYNVEFDFDDLAGIEINGVYYDLVEE